MKQRFARSVVLALATVLVFAAVPVRADWIFAHGTAAAIQRSTESAFVSFDFFGWGLDVKLKKNTSAWVHLPLPNRALDNYYVDKIQLVFRTQNANAYIGQIDLWDGAMKFESLTGKWYSNGPSKTVTINLTKKWKIYRGLSVSLLLKNAAGNERTLAIESVGAHVDDSSAPTVGR